MILHLCVPLAVGGGNNLTERETRAAGLKAVVICELWGFAPKACLAPQCKIPTQPSKLSVQNQDIPT